MECIISEDILSYRKLFKSYQRDKVKYLSAFNIFIRDKALKKIVFQKLAATRKVCVSVIVCQNGEQTIIDKD